MTPSLRRSAVLLAALVTWQAAAASQPEPDPFPVLRGPYLGQEPPGTTPELFAPGIVSMEKYNEFVCLFTPGGEECIFDRHDDDDYPRGAVFVTRIEGGRWTPPEIHPLFEPYGDVFLPTLSPDGRLWFFTSQALPVPAGTQKIIPLYVMRKTETGWSEPEYVTQAIHASATLDGTVYVNAGRPIVSEALPGAIQDLFGTLPFATGHPVISPDGRYLVFDNNDLPRSGDCRLFVIFRTDEGGWSAPASLGGAIRQHAFCAWITPDGKHLFFHSRQGSKGDIYWVSTEIIATLHPASGQKESP